MTKVFIPRIERVFPIDGVAPERFLCDYDLPVGEMGLLLDGNEPRGTFIITHCMPRGEDRHGRPVCDFYYQTTEIVDGLKTLCIWTAYEDFVNRGLLPCCRNK